MIDKVCPVVLRKQNQEILLFQHPLAGIQLVKERLRRLMKVTSRLQNGSWLKNLGLRTLSPLGIYVHGTVAFKIKHGILFCVSVQT